MTNNTEREQEAKKKFDKRLEWEKFAEEEFLQEIRGEHPTHKQINWIKLYDYVISEREKAWKEVAGEVMKYSEWTGVVKYCEKILNKGQSNTEAQG